MTIGQAWIGEMQRTLIGNAASVRDFRVQMRGSKVVWVFGLFVLVLGVFGSFMYWSTIGRGQSLASMQGNLHNFYLAVSALLGGAICLIAPGLTATTIVAERQRQSLDLILCAPVKPQYLLVGKMLGSYRYIWMLLFLALPIVAMSVVLGGATWSDVFGSFLLLSFDGLVFTSLALLVSSLVVKPAAAVFWSLMAVGFYVILISVLSALSVGPVLSGRAGLHSSFVVALSPFTASMAVSTTTVVFGHDVPNWIFACLFSLLLTRFFITSAASTLAPLDAKLVANARISGALYMFLVAILVGSTAGATYSAFSSGMGGPGGSFAGPSADANFTRYCFGTYGWILFAMPMMACFGPDASRRYWPNGFFRIRHTFDGTPSGGLPYSLLVIGVVDVGMLVGLSTTLHVSFGWTALLGALWGAGMIAFNWSIGQYVSSRCNSLRTARVLHLVALVAVYALLPVFLGLLNAPMPGGFESPTGLTPLWYGSAFTVLGDVGFRAVGPTALVLLGFAVVITFAAKRRLAPKLRVPV